MNESSAPYELVITRSAERELKTLSPEMIRRIATRLRVLAVNQHPPQSKRLTNSANFRLRVGDYRVIYAVDDMARTVTIFAIGHRRDVYR